MSGIFTDYDAEESALERAKVTEPFGYIVKPFNDKELLSTIEMALYKHGVDKKLRENLDVQERLNKILLTREFRIKELKDENELLKKKIEEADKRQ